MIKQLRWFIRADDGSASIEIVLVLPLFLTAAGLVVDVSLIFFRQAQLYQVVQDANRSLSLGRLASASAAKSYIETAMDGVAPSTVADPVISGGIVTTTATMQANELQATGLLAALHDLTVRVVASHYIEQ